MCGGSGSAFSTSGSCRRIHSRTARTNACTRRSSAARSVHLAPTWQRSSAAFNRFRREYNEERPHQYLQGRTPGSVYRASSRTYTGGVPDLEYPGHYVVKRVTNAGTVRFKHQLLYLSTALRGHRVAFEEVDDGIWSVYFCEVLLGRLDERRAVETGQLGVTHVPG